jgi:hypothetical protein
MTNQPHSTPWRGQHPVPAPHDATTEYPTVPAPQSWWSRLNPASKAVLIITAAALPLFLCCGGLAVVAAMTGDAPDQSAAAPSTAATSPATTRPSPSPAVVKRTITETEEIPFEEVVVEDSALLEGIRQVQTEGAAGEKTITYEVTITDGVQTSKRRVKEEVTRQPVDRVIVVGTGQPEPEPEPEPREESPCHPSYAGVCVPFATDVDCAGGSGNGPAYVRGPLRVIGPDVYDLDRDGDGIACDANG